MTEWNAPDDLDMPPRYLNEIVSILKEIIPERQVWLYGSRVNGTSYEASDVDLVFFPEKRPVSAEDSGQASSGEWELQSRLKAAFEESRLPLFVDILSWALIPESFRKEILNQRHIVVQ